MPINKFGVALRKDKDTIAFIKESYDAKNREYIRNNTLCLSSSNTNCYDAKYNKVIRVSSPDFDTDATNKRYVDDNIQKGQEHCNSKIESLNIKVDQIEEKSKETAENIDKIDYLTSNLTRSYNLLHEHLNNIAEDITSRYDNIQKDLEHCNSRIEEFISQTYSAERMADNMRYIEIIGVLESLKNKQLHITGIINRKFNNE